MWYFTVVTTGDEALAVRGERQRKHLLLVSREHVHRGALAEVPQLHRRVVPARREQPGRAGREAERAHKHLRRLGQMQPLRLAVVHSVPVHGEHAADTGREIGEKERGREDERTRGREDEKTRGREDDRVETHVQGVNTGGGMDMCVLVCVCWRVSVCDVKEGVLRRARMSRGEQRSQWMCREMDEERERMK